MGGEGSVGPTDPNGVLKNHLQATTHQGNTSTGSRPGAGLLKIWSCPYSVPLQQSRRSMTELEHKFCQPQWRSKASFPSSLGGNRPPLYTHMYSNISIHLTMYLSLHTCTFTFASVCMNLVLSWTSGTNISNPRKMPPLTRKTLCRSLPTGTTFLGLEASCS